MIHDPKLQRRAFDAWIARNPRAEPWEAFRAAIFFCNVAESEGYEVAFAALAFLEKPAPAEVRG